MKIPVKISPYTVFLAVVILAVGTTLLLYYPTLDAFFVADDHLWLKKDSYSEVLSHFYSSWGHGIAYRPIVRISLSVNAILSGSNPLGWHLVNVLIHATNGLLVFLISKALMRWRGSPQLASKKSILIVATGSMLLFLTAANLNVNVSWISARTHSLAATFFLVGTLLLIKERYRPLSVIAFVFSIACYESMAIFPFFGLILLFIKISESDAGYSISRRKRDYFLIGIMVFILILFLLARAKILGIFTVQVSSYSDGLTTSLNNLSELYDIVINHNKWIEPLCVLVIGASIYYKSHRVSILLAMLGGLIIFAPYLPSVNAVPRYTYLFTAYCCVVIPILVSALFQSWITLIMVLVVFGLGHNIKKTWSYSIEFKEASSLALSILQKAKATIIKLPDNKQIFFSGIPAKKNRGWVHATYFDLALKRHFGQLDNNSEIFWDFKVASMPEVLAQASFDDEFYLYKDNEITRVGYDLWIDSKEIRPLIKSDG